MNKNTRRLLLVFMFVVGTLATISTMGLFDSEGRSAGLFDPRKQNAQSVTETGNQQEPDSSRPAENDRYDVDHNWPQWRGPLGTGVSTNADPPIEWSETRNIRWKIALPGQGHSTPIIWGDRIFLTMTVPFGDAVAPKPETAPGAHDNAPVTHHQKFVILALNQLDDRFSASAAMVDGELNLHGQRYLYCLAQE